MSRLKQYGYLLQIFGFLGLVTSKFPSGYVTVAHTSQECQQYLDGITNDDVTAPIPPEISGEWTSYRCETRPGPEYVLRKYKFKHNSFSAHVYYYADEDCKNATHAIFAKGTYRLLRESWRVRGGMDSKYRLSQIYVIPYTKSTTRTFSHLMTNKCKSKKSKTVETYRKFQILQFSRYNKTFRDNYKYDFDCSNLFNFTMNELQLVRMEIRNSESWRRNEIPQWKRRKGRRDGSEKKELFLGDLHTKTRHRQSHRPTSYQIALKPAETTNCPVCDRITNSNDDFPPSLHQHHVVDVPLPGTWVSQRCETRFNGQFVTRQLTFLADGKSWRGQYDFYNDPVCKSPSFTVFAKGHYIIGRKSDVSVSAKEYTFRTTLLKIRPNDLWITEYLNSYDGDKCGKAKGWKVGHTQDVSMTGGCITLGIQLPNIEFELMKTEIRHHRRYLYVGQRPSEGASMKISQRRPTSFQSPLIKCSDVDEVSESDVPLVENVIPETIKLRQMQNQESNSNEGHRIRTDICLLLFLVMLYLFSRKYV